MWTCPACLDSMDGMLEVGDGVADLPESGDVVVCTECGALLKIDERKQLVRATVDDLADLTDAQRAGIACYAFGPAKRGQA